MARSMWSMSSFRDSFLVTHFRRPLGVVGASIFYLTAPVPTRKKISSLPWQKNSGRNHDSTITCSKHLDVGSASGFGEWSYDPVYPPEARPMMFASYAAYASAMFALRIW
jgi:hypothetical protein